MLEDSLQKNFIKQIENSFRYYREKKKPQFLNIHQFSSKEKVLWDSELCWNPMNYHSWPPIQICLFLNPKKKKKSGRKLWSTTSY